MMDLILRRWQQSTLPNACAGDRRTSPRIKAQFCLISAHSSRKEGSGTVRDLSAEGCQLTAALVGMMPQSTVMELRIHIPDLQWTIVVDEAVIEWVKGAVMGVRFVSLRPTEGDRLAWIITRTDHDR
jgi:hypothetical protein